jgi:4-amino-4-deoxy-L-arabinose transferase-like glycosyltransferase
MTLINKTKNLLKEDSPLIVILVGVALVAFTVGPFQTLDTQLELDTTRSILRVGYPILPSTGQILNEPPLGFYTAAVVLKIFGLTISNGTNMVTLFGIGCVIMVFFSGKELYGKLTALFASVSLAFAPWQMLLSRAFLIDTQCLFLSLICLYFGIKAIKSNSTKLTLISGLFFAAAILTKLYAAFILLPLLILYLYRHPRNVKRALSQFAVFGAPAIYANLLWYVFILKEDLLSYFLYHNDFKDLNFANVAPSYSFVLNFLVNNGVGILAILALGFSLLIGLLFRKTFPKNFLLSDAICFVSMLFIIGINMFLGVTLNLKAPYTSAIKFSYQALPFIALIIGSLAEKSIILIDDAKNSPSLKRGFMLAMIVIGVFLTFSPLVMNMYSAHQLITTRYIVFQVQPGQDIGYSLYVDSPAYWSIEVWAAQILGFACVWVGVLWTLRSYFSSKIVSKI